MQWVVDQKQKMKAKPMVDSGKNIGNDDQCGSDDEPYWIKNFTVNKDSQSEAKKIKKKISGFKSDNRRNQESYRDLLTRDLEKEDFSSKKQSENLQKANDASELDDQEFLLEEYASEEEGAIGGGKSKRKAGGFTVSSSSDEEEEEDGFEEEEEGFKVYFCSRTHSQLSQFVKELRKTNFANEIKVVSLGSRKNFCINEGKLILSFM